MKTSPEMPFNIGDYLSDTMGLDRAEHGSYMLLIMAYWKNGGPLPNDDLALRKMAMCPETEWARTRGIMARYFDCSNGVWKHKRIDAELAADRARTAAISRASAAGVEARRALGQIPPPSVNPPVQPSVGGKATADAIRAEKAQDFNKMALQRVEARIQAILNSAVVVAGGERKLTVPQRAELRTLKAKREELKTALGLIV